MSEPAEPCQAESKPRPREPYERPAVTWRETLGSLPTLMAGCGKIAGGGPACDTVGPLSS